MQNIIIHKLRFEVNGKQQELSASFGLEKTGLVGKNGAGKTTLLKLLIGELQSKSGNITLNADIAYLPQDYQFDLEQTVSEAMRLGYEDWSAETRAISVLRKLGLRNPELSRKLKTLSGGERMKVALAGLFVYPERFIIMDEPTNNLDRASRKILYDLIFESQNGMLIVSHDRELLDLMDRIAELSEDGLNFYGGNYQGYEKHKTEQQETAVRLYTTAAQEFRKTVKHAQIVKERQEKRMSHGKKRAKKENLPKIIMGAMKRSGQVTAGKLKTLHDERITDAKEKMIEAKDKIPPQNQVHVDLSKTEVPKGKIIVELENISFGYSNENIIENLSLVVHGQERVAIAGPNGSGKTTLVKLITGELKPKLGSANIGTPEIAYLDQDVRILNPEQNLIENVSRISNLDLNSAREWLAGFQFYGKDPFKKTAVLSGGERIRAGLAAILAGETPAKLIILDEPTNNLDLDSIQKIESALVEYKGNLIVISHDQKFLENIGIERYISME